MSSTKVTLTGGNFQDNEGNLLANGYLTFKLSQDASVNTSQICAGVEVKVTLDGSGNIATSQAIWGNDQLMPINTYYRVTGYKANGQLAWGPNNQQVVGNGGSFDVGTWVPNTVISWNPPAQALVLETNETLNGSQALLDLHAGTGVTLTDNGSGRVTIAASGTPLTLQTNETPNGSQSLLDLHAGTGITLADNGSGRVTITSSGGSTSGYNVAAKLPFDLYYRGSGSQLSTSGFTYAQLVSANSIALNATSTKVGIYITADMTGPLGEMVIIRTLRDSLTTVDVTPITFGGSANPTLLTGSHVSDAISLQIDALHDYYFGFTGNAFGGSGQLAASNAQSSSGVDYTGVAGNTNNGGSPLSASWASAVPAFSSAFPIGFSSFFIASWTVA